MSLPTNKVFRLLDVSVAVKNVAEAMEKLNTLWQSESSEGEYSELVTPEYPFHKDFNELVLDVFKWRQLIKSKVDAHLNEQVEEPNNKIFADGYTSYTPEEAAPLIGCDLDQFSSLDNKILVCNNTKMYIEQQPDGQFYTIALLNDIIGTFDQCVNFLKESL